jgi:hypothetical protein
MSRIRTLKPELHEDEHIAGLSCRAFRLFIGCINMADDYGNLRFAIGRIAGSIYWRLLEQNEITLDQIHTARAELFASKGADRRTGGPLPGLLIPYQVHGQLYAHITGWEKHQRVDRPGPPRCPKPTDAEAKILTDFMCVRKIRERSTSGPGAIRGSHATDQDQDQDPDQDQDQEEDPASAGSEPDGSVHFPVSDEWSLNEPSHLDPQVTEPDTRRQEPDPASEQQSRQAPQASRNVPAHKAGPTSAAPEAPPLQLTAPELTRQHPVDEVFAHYVAGWRRSVGGTRPPRLDGKRRKLVQDRLRHGFSVEDLKRACDGIWLSDFHRQNGHTSIDLIMRDTKHVEQFLLLETAGTDVVISPVEQKLLDDYLAAWSRANGGKKRIADASDKRAAPKVLEVARAGAATCGLSDRRVLMHILGEYLRDADPYLVAKGWPLRCLAERFGQYPLPSRKAPPPEKPPTPEPPPLTLEQTDAHAQALLATVSRPRATVDLSGSSERLPAPKATPEQATMPVPAAGRTASSDSGGPIPRRRLVPEALLDAGRQVAGVDAPLAVTGRLGGLPPPRATGTWAVPEPVPRGPSVASRAPPAIRGEVGETQSKIGTGGVT